MFWDMLGGPDPVSIDRRGVPTYTTLQIREHGLPDCWGVMVYNIECINPGCRPVKYINDIPIYTKEQIDEFGLPSLWGVEEFDVIECIVYDETRPIEKKNGAIDPKAYTLGDDADKHRYSRLDRFKTTLYHLIGERGEVPLEVLALFDEYGLDDDNLWESVRFTLKVNGMRKYYNMIPTIVKKLGGYESIYWGNDYAVLTSIIDHFKRMSIKWDSKEESWVAYKREMGWRYFPLIRYIAFKLLEEHGAEFEYYIPRIRTLRKIPKLEKMWDILYN